MNEKYQVLNPESRENPKTVLEYLRDKHSTIIDDYRNPDGRHSEHCGLIAIEIAKLLIADGKQPYIAMVSESVHGSTKTLTPKIYEGRVTWGAHQVCCCDGLVFDPIVGSPAAIEDYTKTVFGEDINMEVLIPHEQIEGFINT